MTMRDRESRGKAQGGGGLLVEVARDGSTRVGWPLSVSLLRPSLLSRFLKVIFALLLLPPPLWIALYAPFRSSIRRVIHTTLQLFLTNVAVSRVLFSQGGSEAKVKDQERTKRQRTIQPPSIKLGCWLLLFLTLPLP